MRRLVFYLLHLYNKERDGKERGKLKTGMVLEGGGMRGIYTVGVLAGLCHWCFGWGVQQRFVPVPSARARAANQSGLPGG